MIGGCPYFRKPPDLKLCREIDQIPTETKHEPAKKQNSQ